MPRAYSRRKHHLRRGSTLMEQETKMPVLNKAATNTARLFLSGVQSEYQQYLPENPEDYTEFCGQDLFGVTGPLTDDQIEQFYRLSKPEVEIELFNYAVKEGYISTEEMVIAEVSHSGLGIATVEDMRNALAFVFDGAMVP